MTAATTTAADAPPRAGRREWIGLGVLALPTLLVSIDVFVMLLALPSISEALHAGSTQQLWIMDIYSFMLSGFLITMGTLGDRIGRRRLLMIGAAGFGVASIVAAYSTTATMLIVARGALGIAGATLAPSTLALISNMFRDARQRSLAIGLWFACFMGGAVIGPVVGGAMLAHFWWGSVLLIGVPAMVLLLACGRRLLPEFRDTSAGRLDPISVGTSLAAILPIVYGLKELARSGWQPLPLAAVVVGALFGRYFVRRQRRLADPLLDVRLFHNRAFTTALGGMFLGTMLTGAMMLFLTEHLQLVEGMSAQRAGLWVLPSVVAALVTVLVSPLLARKIRPAYLISGGLVVTVCGLLLMTQIGPVYTPVLLAIAWAVSNIGAGPFVSLGTNIVVGSVRPERAGAAAALNETAGEFGFALGIAALGSVGTAVYRARLGATLPDGVPADAARSAHDTLAGATTAAQGLPEQVGAALLHAARVAFTDGLHVAASISAVLILLLAVFVLTGLRGVPPIGAAEQVGSAEQDGSAEHDGEALGERDAASERDNAALPVYGP
jgi:MFS transporter, DHA2 family, multidrug resistance protein